MKNIITAILLTIAMLISLSSCLTAVNVAGENGTDDGTEEIKDSGTEKTEETAEAPVTKTETQEETVLPETTEEPPIFNISGAGGAETKDITKLENPVIPEYPSEDMIKRIEDDFAALHGKRRDEGGSPYYIVRYYGEYDGAVPVKIEGMLSGQMEIFYSVAGYGFYESSLNTINVWKDGSFCTMQEAYDSGMLTEEQVANIAWLHYYGKYVLIPGPDERI
ncbi:MAG: hypothetical protein IKS28_05520 [Clostridia bacterium]|nr:hypothetical protein [Clostridia bacterium]